MSKHRLRGVAFGATILITSALVLTPSPPVTAAENAAPVGVDNTYHVHQGTTLRIGAPGILGNDRDPDGDPLHVVRASGGSGSLRIATDGSFEYTSTERLVGADRWLVTIADSSGARDTQAVTFELLNARPIARPDSFAVAQNGTLTVGSARGVLRNDHDADDDPLEAHPANSPAHGSLQLDRDGALRYTPDPGYAGLDRFTYTADDGSRDSRPATVSITVVAPNVAPVGVRDEYGIAPGRSTVVSAPGVLGNDRDGNGDPLSAVLESDVSHGILSLSDDGSFGYVPSVGFEGRDTFTYRAVDVDGAASAPTVVALEVAGVGEATPVQPSTAQNAIAASALKKPRMTLHLSAHRERPSRRVTVAATVRTGPRTDGLARIIHVAPRGTRLLSITTPAGWTCWSRGRTTKCRIEEMTAGTSARLAFRLALQESASANARSTVTAAFRGDGFTRKRTTQRVGW